MEPPTGMTPGLYWLAVLLLLTVAAAHIRQTMHSCTTTQGPHSTDTLKLQVLQLQRLRPRAAVCAAELCPLAEFQECS